MLIDRGRSNKQNCNFTSIYCWKLFLFDSSSFQAERWHYTCSFDFPHDWCTIFISRLVFWKVNPFLVDVKDKLLTGEAIPAWGRRCPPDRQPIRYLFTSPGRFFSIAVINRFGNSSWWKGQFCSHEAVLCKMFTSNHTNSFLGPLGLYNWSLQLYLAKSIFDTFWLKNFTQKTASLALM